jgi:hypothetical protein
LGRRNGSGSSFGRTGRRDGFLPFPFVRDRDPAREKMFGLFHCRCLRARLGARWHSIRHSCRRFANDAQRFYKISCPTNYIEFDPNIVSIRRAGQTAGQQVTRT